MRKRALYHICICLLLWIPGAIAQNSVVDTSVFSDMMAHLKTAQDLGYTYTLDAVFPNGSKDKMTGETFITQDRKSVYNSNNIFTIILNEHWYYNADHKNKSIIIIDLDKKQGKAGAKKSDLDFLNCNNTATYFDSAILRYAKIKKMSIRNDTVNISLDFPKQMLIKSMELSYDRKEQILVSSEATVITPGDKSAKSSNDTKQSLKCSRFTRKADLQKYNVDNYFKVENGKVVLKKNMEYKLTTRL